MNRPRRVQTIDSHLSSPRRTKETLISFVIPARNEESLIGATIEAIHMAVAGRYAYEVVVVENGSSDRTAEIATAAGATVLSRATGTIGALRNHGVKHSSGPVIVFLDADVVLKAQWSARLPHVLQRLKIEPSTLIGAKCEVPIGAGWIERSWFGTPKGRRSSHIGSGHMILTRRLFNDLQGFDVDLATGEDYDLSQRARQHGAKLIVDRELRAEHMGYPSTIREFVEREIWHGSSDFRSWKALMESKVAVTALVFSSLHLALFGSLLAGWIAGALAASVGILSICVASSALQYRGAAIRVVLLNTLMFYFYYFGRAISAFVRPSASRVRRTPKS